MLLDDLDLGIRARYIRILGEDEPRHQRPRLHEQANRIRLHVHDSVGHVALHETDLGPQRRASEGIRHRQRRVCDLKLDISDLGEPSRKQEDAPATGMESDSISSVRRSTDALMTASGLEIRFKR